MYTYSIIRHSKNVKLCDGSRNNEQKQILKLPPFSVKTRQVAMRSKCAHDKLPGDRGKADRCKLTHGANSSESESDHICDLQGSVDVSTGPPASGG